jgi:hypothetical protein
MILWKGFEQSYGTMEVKFKYYPNKHLFDQKSATVYVPDRLIINRKINWIRIMNFGITTLYPTLAIDT